MEKNYPKGYWSSVFDQAATLMDQRGGLSGETAYWLARRIVDRKLVQAGQFLPAAGLDSEMLVLSP